MTRPTAFRCRSAPLGDADLDRCAVAVENHVQNTLRKLQLHNRAELVRYAIEHGLDE